ncbi:unnamed protein product, partial [Mesorhabditis belari]|uniref:Uncharacterized protein n=1 Tax=Mesorhabditis belari TaxID=2138241 RepID=A0AAF3FIL2_9BILA
MGFDTRLLEVKYLYFPNPYVYYNFTNETTIASDGQRVLYGASKFTLAVILFIFEIAYLMTLKRRKGYGSNFSFTLLFYIGIADFFQLLAHIASAFMLMTLMSSSEYTYLMGSFLEAGFFITGYMTMALPIHRAMHIIFPTTIEKYIRPNMLKGVLVLYLIFAIISFGYFWNSDAGIAYIPESVYWGFTYNRNKTDLNTYMRIVEEWSVLAPIVVGAIFYALIIFTICYKVGKYKTRELRLTAQIFAVLIVCTICYVMWYKFLDAVSRN